MKLTVADGGNDYEIFVTGFSDGFISVGFARSDAETTTDLPKLTPEEARSLAAQLLNSADWIDEN